MRAVICVGISGSGKNTWSEEYKTGKHGDYVVVNRDETRWHLSGNKGWNGSNAYRFNRHIEDAVTAKNNCETELAAYLGQDVIISDTNLNPKFRKQLIERLIGLGYEVEIKEFPISFQEALRRDRERGIFSVGEVVLAKQWEQWVNYFLEKGEGAFG